MHNKLKKNFESTLYIVPTPIGNLEDITKRALSILKTVNFIAAENIQHTKNLLKHFSINAKLISLNNYNEKKITSKLVDLLKKKIILH